MAETSTYSLVDRLSLCCHSLMFYPRAMLIQWKWYPLYEIPFPFDPWARIFVLSEVGLLALLGIMIALRRRAPGILIAWLCYAGLILPVSGIMQAGLQMVADRYSYMSTMPLAVLLGGGFAWWWSRPQSPKWSRLFLGAVCLGYLIACALFTARQTQIWKDEKTLWTHALKRGPSALGLNNMAAHLGGQGQPQAAIEHYIQSLAILPYFELARNNLIPNLATAPAEVSPLVLAQGNAALRKSLQQSPQLANGWYALGEVDERLGDYRHMLTDFEQVTASAPRASKAWLGLGKARNRLGQFELAAEALQKALAINPKSTEALVELAYAQSQMQMIDAARCTLQQAAELDASVSPALQLSRIAEGTKPVASTIRKPAARVR
jgi:predicted TPR repeat methyltransferase